MHIEKYHVAEHQHVVLPKQLPLICAMFEQQQAGCCLELPISLNVCTARSFFILNHGCDWKCERFGSEVSAVILPPRHDSPSWLARSAPLIRSWSSADAETLRFPGRQNHIDLVRVLTGSGPRLVLKAETQEAFRLNKVLYYDASFASLLLAKALCNHGKVQGAFLDMEAEWTRCGCECVFLCARRRKIREELLEEVLNHAQVRALRSSLILQATHQHEWVVCSHDATYQTLFSIIGQEKMMQKEGEKHALHTVVGRTGCLPGWSLQRTESAECFGAAMVEILPVDARSTCRFVFTDSPAVVVKSSGVLPNLVGVGEDALHLVLRVEACTGEKRTAMSAHLLRMQLKFRQPLEGPFYHGAVEEGDVGQGKWCDVCVERDWGSYGKLPYVSHQDYLDDLSTVCHSFPDFMRRQDAKGRSVRQILDSGASYSHFRFLQNGSLIVGCLQGLFSEKDMELLSWGTCANEALHFQLKHVQRTIVQQHTESMSVKLSAFSLGKLLCHNAAAYHPTLAQRSSAEILAILEGQVRRRFFDMVRAEGPTHVTSVAMLRQPAHALDTSKCERRSAVAFRQQKQWAKELKKRERKNAKRAAPKGHVRTVKRTVFSQRKCFGQELRSFCRSV